MVTEMMIEGDLGGDTWWRGTMDPSECRSRLYLGSRKA